MSVLDEGRPRYGNSDTGQYAEIEWWLENEAPEFRSVLAASSELATFARLVLLPEPVSPELVLVDPELARRERARLEERAELAAIANVAALRRVVEREASPSAAAAPREPEWRSVAEFSRRRLLPAALMLSLFANGLVVANLVTGVGRGASSQDLAAVRVVTLAQGSATSPTTSVASVRRETSAASVSQPAITPEPSSLRGGAKAAVERRLASLIISAPVRRFPRLFVDPSTGLVKNNVQVVCRRRTPRSFLCVVRLPNRPPNEGLYVRYRRGRNGRGAFTWYGYTPGLRR
jgi:hypothetical protein